MSRQPIHLTDRGEAVLGTLAGLAFFATIVFSFAVIGDFLGI